MIQTKKDFLLRNQGVVKTTNAGTTSLVLSGASLAIKGLGLIGLPILYYVSPTLALLLSGGALAAKMYKELQELNIKDLERYQMKEIAKNKNISEKDLRVVEAKSLKTKKWSTASPGVYIEYSKYENLPKEEKENVDGLIAPKTMVPYAKMLLKEDPNDKQIISPEKKAYILKLKQTEPHLAETYEKYYNETLAPKTELTGDNSENKSE